MLSSLYTLLTWKHLYFVQTDVDIALLKAMMCAQIKICLNCHLLQAVSFSSLHLVINMLTLTQRAHHWPLILIYVCAARVPLRPLLFPRVPIPSRASATMTLTPHTALVFCPTYISNGHQN